MSVVEKGQILTANRLRDGIAVFLTRSGEWSEAIDDAVLALEPEAAAALEQRAKLAEAACIVTGSYLVDAERRGGHVRASHIRERMRALGPTVRPDLGKQAEGKANGFAAPEGV
jgi:nucleotide-binding universal stress UspA family protein